MAVLKVISAIVSPVDASSCKSLASLSSINKLETKTIKEESYDEEEISNEEMAHSYKVM